MKRTLSILLLLALLLLVGCNDPKPVTETLHRAEALMNEEPDSAWTLLNTISPDEMEQNRNRALYALLYTQAQDKTYRDETNDSLISVAVDYYCETDDVRHKFLSYYYKGRVHFNIKDYLNAMTCYMEAEQLASEVGDDYLVGLLYAELGRIYRLYYDYPKSLEAHQKAAECYERAGKIRHRNYMWYNQSDVTRNLNHYKESERLLQMAIDAGKKENDITLIRLCLGDLIMLCIDQNRMKEARMLYHEFKNWAGDDYRTASFVCSLAQMYMAEQNYKQAEVYMKEGWSRAKTQMDSVRLYLSSSELSYQTGNLKDAYEDFLKGISLQESVTHQTLQQPVLTAQRDYLSDKLEFEAYRLQMERKLRVLYILLSVLLLMTLSFAFWRIIKKNKHEALLTINRLEREKEETEKKRMQAENEYRNISALLSQLENESVANTQTIEHLRTSLNSQREAYRQYVQNLEQIQQQLYADTQTKSEYIASLLKNYLEFMGEWILLYEDGTNRKSYREKKIKEEVAETKSKYFTGEAAYRNLEKLVNMYHDNVMKHFREEISLTDEKDYQRVCRMFAGMPPHIIAWAMNETVDVIYQRKSRLRKKIASLSCPHREYFLVRLSK